MNANELRIDNLFKWNGDLCSIMTIAQHSIWVYFLHDEKQRSRTLEVSITDLEPIPLSEEILLKCGFELITEDGGAVGYYTFYDKDGFEVNCSCGLWFLVAECLNHPKIKYLHQLQNLYFALTQTELTPQL